MTLPELHLADWRATKDTLHLYSQILGKIRLATTAPRNHWWNVPLYVDVRGLTTRRLHHRGTTFDITIDFIDHALVVRTSDGGTKSFGLGSGVPVGDFDARIHAILGELGIDVEIREEPFGVPMTTPFAQDLAHASWDREAIARFGRILDWSSSSAGPKARCARGSWPCPAAHHSGPAVEHHRHPHGGVRCGVSAVIRDRGNLCHGQLDRRGSNIGVQM